jgi:DNA-binding NarL/FixJ family response regulator
MRIVAQCHDLDRLLSALEATRGAILLYAASMGLDTRAVIARTHAAASRIILIAENGLPIDPDVNQDIDCLLYRNVQGSDLLACIRRVAAGQRCIQIPGNVTSILDADTVGVRVRDRLTPKEMQIVALVVQGCKNKHIATQLNTKEQVIKNYLRSIYDKTGVSDRLELALFTIHHRVLAEAAARAGDLLQAKTA